eukprot:1249237-Amphidinium_carterae.1
MIVEANNFLRKKGLFPEDHDSDDDEMVFDAWASKRINPTAPLELILRGFRWRHVVAKLETSVKENGTEGYESVPSLRNSAPMVWVVGGFSSRGCRPFQTLMTRST